MPQDVWLFIPRAIPSHWTRSLWYLHKGKIFYFLVYNEYIEECYSVFMHEDEKYLSLNTKYVQHFLCLVQLYSFCCPCPDKTKRSGDDLVYNICNFFFSAELRKFTISDFPKQTHFGHILITLFFFLYPLIDPHIDIVFQPIAWANTESTKTFLWSIPWVKCGSIKK